MSAMPYQQSLPPAFEIRQLRFLETGTYNDMYRRPYQTHVSRDTLQAFGDATQGGTNLNVGNVASVAGEILRPAAQVRAQDQVGIPQGWGERRFLFMMEIFYPAGGFASGEGTRQLISGSTNYVGASNLTGAIRLDPKMELYINSVVTLKTVSSMGPHGPQTWERIIDASQILNEPAGNVVGGFGQYDHPVTLRPQDVFENTQTHYLSGDVRTLDTRQTFSHGMKKSLRENNLAPSYISRVANAYQTSLTQVTDDTNMKDIMTNAKGLVQDPLLTRDKFIKLISDMTQFNYTGFITYGELCRMQPGLDNITDVIYQDKRALHQYHTRGQTAEWVGANQESVIASILFQSVPAVMVQFMLTRIQVRITNRTLDGSFDIRPTQILGYQSMPIDERIWMPFINRLKSEVLVDITQNNQIDMDITLTIDVTGESSLDISIAGQPSIPFCVPSFADARFVPVVANNFDYLNRMAHDMSMLCDNVKVEFGHHPSAQSVHDEHLRSFVGERKPNEVTLPTNNDNTFMSEV